MEWNGAPGMQPNNNKAGNQMQLVFLSLIQCSLCTLPCWAVMFLISCFRNQKGWMQVSNQHTRRSNGTKLDLTDLTTRWLRCMAILWALPTRYSTDLYIYGPLHWLGIGLVNDLLIGWFFPPKFVLQWKRPHLLKITVIGLHLAQFHRNTWCL